VAFLIEVRDRAQLRALLRDDPRLHVYELGDLDDRFWPFTRWFVHGTAVALLYSAADPPVLAAFGPGRAELLGEVAAHLPARVYAHLSPGLATALAPRLRSVSHGAYLKMALADTARVRAIDAARATVLGPGDAAELVAFYKDAYPTSWFDARVLATGCCTGVREHGRLVAAAGVHVMSATERVAAIGNVAVAVDHRGRGLSTVVTAATCQRLLRDVDVVGLNVKADNAAARACYTKLGFVDVAPYEEHQLEAV
jgi:ribosomal protein S18 acetylase RimI-like enzyme